MLDVLNRDMSLKRLFMLYFKISAAVLVAALCLAALIIFLKQKGLVFDMYNVQLLSAEDVFKRILTRAAEPWRAFFTPMPYCPSFSPLLAGGLLLSAFAAMRSGKERLWFVFAILGTGFAMSVSSWFAVKEVFHYYRTNSFSFPYVAALFFAVAELRGGLCVRNSARVMVLLLLFYFVQADLAVQKVWYLGNQQDTKIMERVKKDVLPEITRGQRYRMAVVGNLYGQAKFAENKFIPEYTDYVREYGYYPFYLPIFFSHGFFLTEAMNPVAGDANYYAGGMIYINNNEHLSAAQRNAESEKLYEIPADVSAVYNAIETLSVFPAGKYYFVGTKDIIIRFSDGLVQKSKLHRYLY